MNSDDNGFASRASFEGGVKKAVSTMPSGPKMRCCRTSPERRAFDDLDHAAEHVGRDAIFPDLAGLMHERKRSDRLDIFGQRPVRIHDVRAP